MAKDRAVQQEREALPHYLFGGFIATRMRPRRGSTTWCNIRLISAARLAYRSPPSSGSSVGGSGSSPVPRPRLNVKQRNVLPRRSRPAWSESRRPRPERRRRIGRAWKPSIRPTPRPFRGSLRGPKQPLPRLQPLQDEKIRAALWRDITADKSTDAELRRFSAAVRRRFSDETVRAMLRAEGRPVVAASVPASTRPGSQLSAGPSTHSDKVSGPARAKPQPSASHSVKN